MFFTELRQLKAYKLTGSVPDFGGPLGFCPPSGHVLMKTSPKWS